MHDMSLVDPGPDSTDVLAPHRSDDIPSLYEHQHPENRSFSGNYVANINIATMTSRMFSTVS